VAFGQVSVPLVMVHARPASKGVEVMGSSSDQALLWTQPKKVNLQMTNYSREHLFWPVKVITPSSAPQLFLLPVVLYVQ
jgi:hypothetical protein